MEQKQQYVQTIKIKMNISKKNNEKKQNTIGFFLYNAIMYIGTLIHLNTHTYSIC